MKKEELHRFINSDEFMSNLQLYVDKFRKSKGFGTWLAEYKRMDVAGYFSPKMLKDNFVKILNDVSALQYIYWEAIHYIGQQALDKTVDDFNSYYYDIRCITGEIAEDDNGEELLYLDLNSAIEICESMNTEAEELLFRVYNSNTDKPIK
jgi:hypothetical protein